MEPKAQLRHSYLASGSKSAKAWPAVHNAQDLRVSLDGCNARPPTKQHCRASLQKSSRQDYGIHTLCDLVATVP